MTLHTQDFYYDLPEHLIAQHPLPKRSDARLLVYDRTLKTHKHSQFHQLAALLKPGDLLVMNNSRVIPARFYGKKVTGGQVEFLLEHIISANFFLAHIKASKALRDGMVIHLNQRWQITVIGKQDELYQCQVNGDIQLLLAELGHIPLPLYVNRSATDEDKARFQTVYAEHDGSVAAPTAGLHFDTALLQQLTDHGIEIGFVTLHIGAGTFKPVRSQKLNDHVMHHEQCYVSEVLCKQVNTAKASGRRVIAVGTTTMRSLESAAQSGQLIPFNAQTNIFITPGFMFSICDGLITNFHLPKSTLLMLVAAFIGHQETLALYREAIAANYRFYSYGDANLLF